MKSPIIAILLCTAMTCAHAQQSHESVAAEFKGVTVAFHSDPQNADAKLLPLVDGRSTAGSKERFGLCLGGVSGPTKAIDILDKGGLVLKSISVGDLLSGKGAGFTLLAQPAPSSAQRWIEKKYAVDLPKEKVQLLLKALATGDAADQQLVVTIALKSDAATTLGLRASLPVSGNVEKKDNGFLLSPKNGSAAIAAAVYPGSANISTTKSVVTLTSGPISLAASKESSVLWLVLHGVGPGTTGNAKEQAGKVLREKRFGESDPRIVVVSNTDKPTTQPGDVVTYSLICRNIGTGDATDVTLSNPVSEGLQYLEGSATSDGSSVSFDAKGNGVAVRNIHWKFNAPIRPGEERSVSFKVRVQ